MIGNNTNQKKKMKMNMMMRVVNSAEEVVDWSNLPMELWALIAQRLSIDVLDLLRFRSSCSWFRSVSPPPPSSLFPFPPLPPLPSPNPNLKLYQTRIYRVQPCSNSSKSWLIKLCGHHSTFLPIRIINPFTNTIQPLSPRSRPGSSVLLNVVNFRFVELVHAFSFSEVLYPIFLPSLKAVLLPPPSRLAFTLFRDGCLAVSRIDGREWTPIVMDDPPPRFHDLILRRGHLYALDKSSGGTLMRVDCSSPLLVDLVTCSRPLNTAAEIKHLVEFGGSLYVVDQIKHLVEFGGSLYVVDLYLQRSNYRARQKDDLVFDVGVYRLIDDSGCWLKVNALGGAAFILGRDSNFSVHAQDYYGCTPDCVYFYGWDGVNGHFAIHAFSLKTSNFLSSPEIFWPCPPPSLFHPTFNL